MIRPPAIVLDASALLMVLFEEPGGLEVAGRLDGATISSVNWAEVVQKSLARGAVTEGLRADLETQGVAIVPFDAEDAETTARLWVETQPLGLSPGDRACLALALRLGVPALTADQSWSRLRIGVQVEVVR